MTGALLNPAACAAFLVGAFTLAGVSQTAWLALPLSRRFAIPLDGGRTFRGRRIFGANKTLRGFVIMVPATGLSFAALAGLLEGSPSGQTGLWPGASADYGLLGMWGGKAQNLARLIALGAPVPEGTVLTRAAFDEFIAHNRLTDRLERLTRALDPNEPERLRRTAEAIRTLVMTATLPAPVQDELHAIAGRLPLHQQVAVRSSAGGEDGARASFAGQFDSILGVRSEAELRHAVLACWASCWSNRALFYRAARRLPFSSMAVIV